MECILPYHESLLFSRFVHILRIKNTRWEFLLPIQKSGAPLLREILVQRCHTDFTVLEFICQITTNMISNEFGFKTLITFSTCIVIEYIEFKKINEVHLRNLFSFILEGIKSENSDFKNGSLMMLTQVSSKIELLENILNLCIDTLIHHINEFNLENTLYCLVFLFQNQNIKKFNPKSFKELISFSHFFEELKQLSNKFNLRNFLKSFFSMLVDYCIQENDSKLFSKYFDSFDVEMNDILVQLFFIFKKDQKLIGMKNIILLIRSKNLQQIDEGISFLLKNYPEEQETISNFLNLFFKGKHQFIEETNTTLFLTMEHPEASIRKMAIERLATSEFNVNLHSIKP
jgi:U3 small nucleolar RNA-associated protein 10